MALDRDGQPEPPLVIVLPTYSTPAKTLYAAEAAAAELTNLEGEELPEQHLRVQTLLATANRQQAVQR